MKSKRNVIVIVVFIMVLCTLPFAIAQNYIALQGSVSGATTGNITVEIYDAASSGNLLYNSTTDFFGAINNSRYDVLLGNGSIDLFLNYGTHYFMNIIINEKDMDFNGTDRQVFESSVGNLTVTTPISTTSAASNAFTVNGFNVSGANANMETNGTVQVESTSSTALLVNGFNVSGANANMETNGTVFVTSGDGIRVLNQVGIAFGGGIAGAPQLSVVEDGNGVLNISGIGAPVIFSVHQFFNVSQASSAVRTNGTVTVLSGDTDGALNVTGGVHVAEDASTELTVGTSGFKITNLGNLQTRDVIGADGTITVRSTGSPAFTVNDGFNVSGANSDVTTNGSIIFTEGSGPRVLNQVGFGFGGTQAGPPTITLVEDGNGVLNFTGGTFSVNQFFNVSQASSAVRTNGTVTVLSGDTDGALNVTGGVHVAEDASTELTVGTSGFKITNLGNLQTRDVIGADGTITVRSTGSPAFTVNDGFNVSGANNELSTNNSIVITGGNGLIVKDNVGVAWGGTGTDPPDITSIYDPDAAVLVFRNAMGAFGPAVLFNVTPFSVAGAFNVTSSDGLVKTNLSVLIDTEDTDDALNITGGVQFFDVLTIGRDSSTIASHVDLFDGGDNKCAYLTLYEEDGTPQYIFVQADNLRIHTSIPATCDEGVVVGAQS